MGSKASATFTSQNGKQEILTMRGNWFDTTADITDEAQGGMFIPVIFPHTTAQSRPGRLTFVFGFAFPNIAIGLVVARIDRKLLSGKDIFFGQQTYAVQIAPGVDMALIAAMCICLDEKNNEK